MPVAISLNSPIEDLHQFRIARLGEILSRKLAAALASYSIKKQAADATVEDLLNYLPMRYEDRSHLARIEDLKDGMEASLELQVKLAGGDQVRNKRAFGKSQLFIFEALPADLRQRAKLISRAKALREIHFPPQDASMDDYERSRSPAHVRMIFEDFFWLAFAVALKRGKRTKESKGAIIKIDSRVTSAVSSVLQFKLTRAQRKVVLEIFNDMKSVAPMNRLLQGDVGSGKTIVALIAMIAAMENEYQTALMAPTEILAEQHARNIKRLLAKTPYRVELLTGSLRASEKRRLQAALKGGEIHACIGTQALIQEVVSFARLGLVVIDEQHRFGVMQRAELRARGFNPDVLVMTATPIPRSLAMTVYGDLDVSVINQMPPGRTPIETRVF